MRIIATFLIAFTCLSAFFTDMAWAELSAKDVCSGFRTSFNHRESCGTLPGQAYDVCIGANALEQIDCNGVAGLSRHVCDGARTFFNSGSCNRLSGQAKDVCSGFEAYSTYYNAPACGGSGQIKDICTGVKSFFQSNCRGL